MTRAASIAPTAHILRKTPEKLHAGGLHSIQATAGTFGTIKVLVNAAPETPALWRNATTSRDYTGPELAPYTGRPGAMDAFNQPSRVGSTLFYRDGRTEAVK